MTVRHQLTRTLGTLHQIAFDLEQFTNHTVNPSTRLLYNQCLQDVEQVIEWLEQRHDYLTTVQAVDQQDSVNETRT